MPSESVFYLTGIFLLFGLLVYIYLNFFESDKSESINADYLTGLKYLLDEESDKAINIFSNLIEIDDETIQTHLALGVLFRKQGRVDKAIQLHEYILSKDEGGRHTPFFKGYKPQFYMRTTDVTGSVTLPDGVEMVMPGDNIKMTVELGSSIAMNEGMRFAIREGGRTVGAGVVARIIE